MKKFLGVFCAILLMFSMTACGGKKSTDEQEKAVKDFFSYIEKGDFESVKKITTEDGYSEIDYLQKMLDMQMSEFEDESYGDVTRKEAEGYKDHVLKKFFKDIKIKEVEAGDDDTVIKVTGKQLKTSGFSARVSTINSESMMEAFIKEGDNEATLQNIYDTKGEQEAVKWLVDQIAPDMFGKMKQFIDECPYESYNQNFRLIEKDGKWLIDTIN